MQIIYGDERWDLDNNETAITKIIEIVNDAIKTKDTVFTHLVIDGVDVYENHETYIQDRMDQILEVVIVTRRTKEMIWETMESIHEYLERAIPSLKDLIEESYESFNETWKGIDQLAEGMQSILQFVAFTQNAPQQPSYWSNIEETIQSCENNFAQLLDAVEVKDTVLILDILSYEIAPAYEELAKYIGMSLENEEFLKDVN